VPASTLFDNLAEWPEVALALGVAFVGAYIVAAVVGRLFRWVLQGILGADDLAHTTAYVTRPLFAGQVVIFILTWAALTVPLLDAVGMPLAAGMRSDALQTWLLGSGFRIAVVLVVAWLVLRVALITTRRLERELSAGTDLSVIDRTKRAQTLSRLVHNVLVVLVTLVALLMVLRELGVDILPMLTGAGIAGVALGFGAQWLVRDIIAGFFLILENHVRVGDVAAVNGVGGVVEGVNLRTIVLRDLEGTVHVFQNGAINTLANRSRDFAYAVLDINVQYGQDTDRVAEVLRQVGAEMRDDPTFQEKILEPLEVLGVDAFLDAKVTIRARIKTAPLKQWEVAREARRRIMIALRQQGVPLMPTQVPLYAAEGRKPAASGDRADEDRTR
jgi:moderate conductance mechanosensitive channel